MLTRVLSVRVPNEPYDEIAIECSCRDLPISEWLYAQILKSKKLTGEKNKLKRRILLLEAAGIPKDQKELSGIIQEINDLISNI